MPEHIIVLEEWEDPSIAFLKHRLIFDASDDSLHFQFLSWGGGWMDCDGGEHTPVINKEERHHAKG